MLYLFILSHDKGVSGYESKHGNVIGIIKYPNRSPLLYYSHGQIR